MKDNERSVLIIAGPTAVGKSNLAINLAIEFQAEIISADSRQVYRKLDIGTAKVPSENRKGIPHHLIDILDLDQQYSAAQFCDDAINVIQDASLRKKNVIICGGTGFYLHSLMEGLDQIPEVPRELRKQIEEEVAEKGIAPLQNELKQIDPTYYQQVDPSNLHRLIRAIAVARYTGQPFSSYHLGRKANQPFDYVPILLTMDRVALYERINKRVELMLAQGLEDEVLNLEQFWSLASLQTVGYQEFIQYYQGVHDRKEAIRLIKRNSRRYAKRQFTWFNNHGNWEHYDVANLDAILNIATKTFRT